jgi:carbonic anhydrase
VGAIDDVVAANRQAASDAGAALSARPARALAILTCMDVRIEASSAFGLALGDAHVLRNAGGRVTDDVIRSLAVSSHLLGSRAVMVVHHTACGMLAPDPDEARRRLEQVAGTKLGELDLLTFADEEGAVRDDVALLRGSPLLPADTDVRGFLYDVETGLLREVTTTDAD